VRGWVCGWIGGNCRGGLGGDLGDGEEGDAKVLEEGCGREEYGGNGEMKGLWEGSDTWREDG